MRSLKQCVAGLTNILKAAKKAPISRQARLSLEALEARELLSVTPVVTKPITTTQAVIKAVTPTYTMEGLARQWQNSGQIKAPTAPTELFLNFDGWNKSPYGNNKHVDAFGGTIADEQEILYHTAEIFSPFNVTVSQIYGDGAFSTDKGATTIFVGPNGAGGFTPVEFMDYPCANNPNGGTSHLPNSDAYDIAFVDPTIGTLATSDRRNYITADAIAHEAGHTFGLAHVRTDGQADYPSNPITGITPSVTNPPDAMSYDSNDDFFSNNDYNVTEANGNSVDPGYFPNYKGTNVTMQNSFAYLTTVLGARSQFSQVNVVDENLSVMSDNQYRPLNLVDPVYFADANPHTTQGVRPDVISGSTTRSATLLHAGDYAAYRLDLFNANFPANSEIAVMSTSGMSVNYMVFDITKNDIEGGSRVAFTSGATAMGFYPEGGHQYALVVSGVNGQAGSFSFTIGALMSYLPGANFTVKSAANVVTGQLVITDQIGVKLTGKFTPNDGSKLTVDVTGFVGPLGNGSTPITFSGVLNTNMTTDLGEGKQRTDHTSRTLTFTGQFTQTYNAYVLSGTGSYTVTVTTTIKDVKTNKGTQTTKTTETLNIVSGTALHLTNPPPTPGGPVNLPTTNTMALVSNPPPAPQTVVTKVNVAALDALMVQKKPSNPVDALFAPFGNMVGGDPLLR